MKVHKKFPPGTELSPGGYDTLSIWAGDVMAYVDGSHYDDASEHYFDPERVAQRFVVFRSDIPAQPRLLGQSFDFKYGYKTYWEQPFYFRYGSEMRSSTGQFEPPFDYWVEAKLRSLGPRQTQAVVAALRDKGYVEASWRYVLPAGKWRKLLGMTFEETQNQDAKEANAVDDVIERLRSGYSDVEGAQFWESLPGVYAMTKRGTLKFIVSRNRPGAGL